MISEGLHVTTGWDHDFNNDGIFVVNGEILAASEERGLHILVHTVDTGNYTWQVIMLIDLCIEFHSYLTVEHGMTKSVFCS